MKERTLTARQLIGAYIINWGSEMRPTDIEHPVFGTLWEKVKIRPRWYWWFRKVESLLWWWGRELTSRQRMGLRNALSMAHIVDGPSLFLTSRWNKGSEA